MQKSDIITSDKKTHLLDPEFLDGLEQVTAINRSCDGCIACCDGSLMFDTITQSGKRIFANTNHFCFYCGSDGEGCTGYNDRPDSCKEFRCEYLTDPGIPEFLAPKRSGIILMNKLGDDKTKAWVATDSKSYKLDWYALFWIIAWANETERDLMVTLSQYGQRKFRNRK